MDTACEPLPERSSHTPFTYVLASARHQPTRPSVTGGKEPVASRRGKGFIGQEMEQYVKGLRGRYFTVHAPQGRGHTQPSDFTAACLPLCDHYSRGAGSTVCVNVKVTVPPRPSGPFTVMTAVPVVEGAQYRVHEAVIVALVRQMEGAGPQPMPPDTSTTEGSANASLAVVTRVMATVEPSAMVTEDELKDSTRLPTAIVSELISALTSLAASDDSKAGWARGSEQFQRYQAVPM